MVKPAIQSWPRNFP